MYYTNFTNIVKHKVKTFILYYQSTSISYFVFNVNDISKHLVELLYFNDLISSFLTHRMIYM